MLNNFDRNVLSLAYIGDGIYELIVRDYLLSLGNFKVNDLQHMAIKYVSAGAQREILERIMSANILDEKEQDIVLRARNHKGSRHPKNSDIITYKYATALEALFGYLYLEKNFERIEVLKKYVIGE